MAIQFGQIRGSQIKQTTIETGHIRGTIAKEKLDLGHLVAEDQRLQTEIESIKAAVGDKNSNTKVFPTMAEFNTFAENASPKVGDLVFVIDVKKSYIYKGVDPEVTVKNTVSPQPPAGWMFFDEISSEVDLVEYAKISDMQAADTALGLRIDAVDSKADATNEALGTFKTDLKAETGAKLVGAVLEGVEDKTVQGVITNLGSRVTTSEGKINTLNGNATTEGSVDYKIKQVTDAQTIKDSAQDNKIAALEASIGTGEGSLGQKVENIEQKNTEQDAAINANKQAIHVHKKLVKSIKSADDKNKVVTATEFDIPVGAEGVYEDCTHVYVNGILQAEGINFSFINSAGEVATEGKGKGVSFGTDTLVEGDTVVLEWVEKRFPQA